MLKSSANSTEAENILKENIPDWLLYSMEAYSADYPTLQKNWEYLCGKIGNPPQKIVIVENVYFDDEHKVLMEICNFLTKNGYCIRRKDEYIPCEVCEKAVPCVEIYENLKRRGITVPDIWRKKCKEC